MDLAVLKEGKAILYVPETKNAMIKPGIIEPSHLPVFYNPVMIFNRDVSMVSLSSFIEVYWPGKKLNAIDALSATGVRGIRYSLEVSNLSELIINDNDPLAYEIMLKNIKLNKVEDKVKAYKREANSLMRSLKFEENKPINIIDLDPFGSIIPFIDSAISISSKGSLLALTATDLAVIGGSKFRAAKRKYQVNLINTKHYREIAVRALIAYIAKISAAYDRSIIPLLSYSSDHYARLYLLIDKGAKKAENMLEKEIGYFILYNGLMEFADNYSEKILGPIWKGEIINKDFAVNIYNNLINNYKYLESYERIEKFFNIIIRESELQNYLHQRIDTICQYQHKSMPSIEKFIEELEKLNYKASRSSFSSVGIRTNAPIEVLVDICKKLSK